MNEFGRAVKKYRQDYNLTQKELGSLLHYTESTISYWERGERIPDIDTIRSVLSTLKLPFDQTMDPKPTLSGSDISKIVSIANYDIPASRRLFWIRLAFVFVWIVLTLSIPNKHDLLLYFVLSSACYVIFDVFSLIFRKTNTETYSIHSGKQTWMITSHSLTHIRKANFYHIFSTILLLIFGVLFNLISFSIVYQTGTEPDVIYILPIFLFIYLFLAMVRVRHMLRNHGGQSEISSGKFNFHYEVLVGRLLILIHDLLYVYFMAFILVYWTQSSSSIHFIMLFIPAVFNLLTHLSHLDLISRLASYSLTTK